MDILQLQYVIAIADSSSMNDAAQKVHVSQSALSLSYRKLEQELGVRLFVKSGRRLELTQAGEIFYEKAQNVISAMNELRSSMKSIYTEQQQRIYVCTEAVDYTNEAVKLYAHLHPEPYFQQVRGSTDEIRSMLASGLAEFAVTLSSDFGPKMEAKLLLREPMYALVKSAGKYANMSKLQMKDLIGERLVTLRDGLAVNRLFHSYFELSDTEPERVIEVNDPETIVSQVCNGFGISFIPESTANLNQINDSTGNLGVKAIPIEEEYCCRQIYLITPKGKKLSKNAKQFVDYLIAFGEYTKENHCFPTKATSITGKQK